MKFTLVKALVRPVLEDNRIVGYVYHRPQKTETYIKECAFTRAFAAAIAAGRIGADDIIQVVFEDESGNVVPTTGKAVEAYTQFWQQNPDWHPFVASQNMVQSGKLIASRRPVRETLAALWGTAFAQRIDLHKFFKLMQIAFQPGRLLGDIQGPPTKDGTISRTQPIGTFPINAFIDEKRDEEDGMIFVDPEYWPVLLEAYGLKDSVTLIKVNSMTDEFTIKGVLQKADPEFWNLELANRVAACGHNISDIQMILCGNALKDNVGFKLGEVYELDERCFAYHDDSAKQRGYKVNASKQLQTRSGWDNEHFIGLTCEPVFKTLQGLLSYDEETVLRVIGAFNEDGEETGLDNDIAVKNRILYHRLPANHPTNATQIQRRALSYIKDHLSKVEVPGFHGMGGVSHVDQPGTVLVPFDVYKRFLRMWGTNDAYLFRMPYLGSYCGKFVKLAPYATDTILVHWEDALQMEGDFDGDNYYVIPSGYVLHPEQSVKPARPAKKAKEIVALTDEGVATGIVDLATAKAGIGNRDNLLSVAYDWYHYWQNEADLAQDAIDAYCETSKDEVPNAMVRAIDVAEANVELWRANIAQLQIYEQQAIEGLKHSAEGAITEADVALMFGNDTTPHIYTKLMAKANFNSSTMSIQGTRTQPGYLQLCREAVSDMHAWHPLHPIFTQLAKLELGSVCDILPYWNTIKVQRTRAISNKTYRDLFAPLRRLQKQYAESVSRWNGGKNKNMSFGEDVLKPIRENWVQVLALAAGKSNQAAIERDLCLMLANVAYEPQPNWEMIGTDLSRGLGVFTRMRRFPDRMQLLKHHEATFTGVVKRNDHKPLCDGIVAKQVGNHVFRVRLWLPRPGSLFHHLVEPAMAVDILRDALPTIDFDRLMAQALRKEFPAMEQLASA